MPINGGPNTVKSGLVFELDAADRNSYVSGSTTWYDLTINKNNGTQMLIVQDQINTSQNKTLQGSTLINFNGTTDNVKITFYTSQGQTIASGKGTTFKAILL